MISVMEFLALLEMIMELGQKLGKGLEKSWKLNSSKVKY